MILGFVLLMTSSRPLVIVAMVILGIADGAQLTALFAIRHRESEEDGTRSQVFITGSSLKITAASLGIALAGHLGPSSLRLALTAAGVAQLAAPAVYGILS